MIFHHLIISDVTRAQAKHKKYALCWLDLVFDLYKYIKMFEKTPCIRHTHQFYPGKKMLFESMQHIRDWVCPALKKHPCV